MCRGKNVCTELGSDPTTWDKYAPLKLPKWASNSINIFESAVNDFLNGNRDDCIEKIKTIKSNDITNWYIEHGQMSGRHRKLVLNIIPPKQIPEKQRDPIRSPSRIQNDVFKRDYYKCRYCGNKLISQEFIRLFIKKLNSPAFQKGKTNLETHGIIHIAWPVADHVIPWNQGGLTALSNLVSACATCNYGKDGFTIEQLGIENPFLKQPIIDNWSGLNDKIELLKKICK